MKTLKIATIIAILVFSTPAFADDPAPAPSSFDLDEEKLEIDADIPSVDLILSFRELQDKNKNSAESFLSDVIESAKNAPF